ncbi:MAG: hypothetical protein P8X46_12630 [Nitrospirales bacterium]
MRIRKATIQCMLVTVFLLAGCGGAQSGQMTILNGSQLPQDHEQKWLVATNEVTALDVVTSGSTVTLNTIGVLRKIDLLPGKAFVWFYKGGSF